MEEQETVAEAQGQATENETSTETSTNDSPPTLKVANLFCGTGSLALMAQEAGMEIVYAHDTNRKNREAFEKKIGLAADSRGRRVYLTGMPKFNTIIASLPRHRTKMAANQVARLLRGRRPDVFILVGEQGEEEGAQMALIREKAQEYSYGVSTGTVALKDTYEPRDEDLPITVGFYHLDPAMLPLIAPGVAKGDDLSAVKVILQRIAQVF